MPFDLSFNAIQYEQPFLRSPQEVAEPTPVAKASTPSLPLRRPDLSLAQVLARDNAEKQWYKLLTHKQRLFVCALFGNGFDFAAAAKEVVPGLSITDARAKGKYWYTLPKVRNAIEAIHAYYQERSRIRWEDIITELRTIAFANIMDFYSINKHGDPELTMPGGDDPRYAAISEVNIEYTRFGPKSKIKMHDKMGAMDKLIKLLQPTSGVSDAGGGSIVVQNINIIPVPQGQFLPAPIQTQAPIIDVTPVRPKPNLSIVS